MNTAPQPISMEGLLQQAKPFYDAIPGMDQLRNATPSTYHSIASQYPDAVFALMVADNLFCHDAEISHIHQAAFFSILRGEGVENARFRYDRDMDAYARRHSWDPK